MLGFRRNYKQYTYVETSSPTVVSEDFLTLVKTQLRIGPDDTTEDSYLSLLINVAYQYAQNYTRRTLLTTSFTTYRDDFNVCCFELRRSPFQSIQSIQYLINNVLTVLDTSKYYTTTESFYAKVLRAPHQEWPFKIDCRQQAIQIQFTAGYGDNYTDLPSDLLMALLQHITMLYESRGDCSDSACASALPAQSKMIYDMYRISDITATQDCGEVYRAYM